MTAREREVTSITTVEDTVLFKLLSNRSMCYVTAKGEGNALL